ncbi:MAG: ornithine lipid ester-linked acyl 2-hydroxylase [Frankiales bacterium]|jgi:beta-hydroxylase|nr:ornithine lipid ester-linked acyl 2-hydroxylase [Frankiales bacterium]
MLETGWPEIRSELDDLLRDVAKLPNIQDISTVQRRVSADNDWKVFFLYGHGYKSELNCSRCPRTASLVESVPGMRTAFFSILAPGKRLPPHRGPYKGLLRYHLGLRVPDPPADVWIKVDGELRHWAEGQSLLFDDTYEHEVWNGTSGHRVVLFLDVIRPLKEPAASINKIILGLLAKTPYVQDARRRELGWERDGWSLSASAELPGSVSSS